jgi:hypothetical protein
VADGQWLVKDIVAAVCLKMQSGKPAGKKNVYKAATHV